MGFSAEEQQLMEIAAYFHDIGKLTVPPEILNKPAKLTKAEWRIMRAHSYYTYQVLEYIDDLPQLKEWAAYHHEKLDGTGYPFQLRADELSTGARDHVRCLISYSHNRRQALSQRYEQDTGYRSLNRAGKGK